MSFTLTYEQESSGKVSYVLVRPDQTIQNGKVQSLPAMFKQVAEESIEWYKLNPTKTTMAFDA